LTLVISPVSGGSVRKPLFNAGYEFQFDIGGKPWMVIVHSLKLESGEAQIELKPISTN
jgi:hypothetical protein